jgi:HipA-like protein
MRKAEVFQQGKFAGTLEEIDRSHYRFTYASDYDGEPVSLALPVREASYEFGKFPRAL